MSSDSQISPSFSLETDTHMHTIASTHAYSTILELATYAKKAGLGVIAITDHGPALPDAPHEWHFSNLHILPPVIHGVRVLHGVEANIMDYAGNLDLCKSIQKDLDWVIASYHEPCCKPGTVEELTTSYLHLAENEEVDVIGHSGRGRCVYDYDRVLPVFKKKNKLVEINSNTLSKGKGSKEHCHKIVGLCKKYAVPVVVNSDAHSCFDVGNTKAALHLLAEEGYPQEWIVNRTAQSLADWILKKKGRNILEEPVSR